MTYRLDWVAFVERGLSVADARSSQVEIECTHISRRSGNDRSGSQVAEVTRKLVEISRSSLSELMDQFFLTTEKVFNESAISSPYPSEQNAFSDAAAELLMLKSGLKNRFLKGVAAGLIDNFFRAKSVHQNVGARSAFRMDNLSLVEKCQMDENAIVVGIVTNARANCRAEMHEFMSRVSVLIGVSIEQLSNPLDPEALFKIFREALGQTQADLQRRSMLFEIFNRELLIELVTVFKKLNDELSSRGVEAPHNGIKRVDGHKHKGKDKGEVGVEGGADFVREAVSRASQQDRINHPMPSFQSEEAGFRTTDRDVPDGVVNQSAGSNSAEKSGTEKPAPSKPASSKLEQIGQVSATASQNSASSEGVSTYISRHYPGLMESASRLSVAARRPISSGCGPVSYVTSDQLNRMLAEIHAEQQARIKGGSKENALAMQKTFCIKEALEKQISEHLPEDKSNTVGKSDSNTIYLISMLFDFILDDPNLPECVKELLARLRIPVVKAALQDRSLLKQSNHVVRKLLNRMAYAGTALNEGYGIEYDPVYKKIAAIVEKVVSDFDGSARVFEEAYLEFAPFIESYRARAKRIEARTAEAAKGRARLIGLKKRAFVTMRSKVETFDYNVPDFLQQFIFDEWFRLLVRIGLKQSSGGKNWKVALQAVDIMLWSQHPHASPYSLNQWPKRFELLKRNLSKGLSEVSSSSTDKFLSNLESGHAAALASESSVSSKRVDPKHAEFDKPVRTDNPAKESVQVMSKDNVKRESRSREVDGFEVGDWFKISAPGSTQSINGKLIERFEIYEMFIFVNGRGQIILEANREELVDLLAEDRIMKMQSGPLMDRGFMAILDACKGLGFGDLLKK